MKKIFSLVAVALMSFSLTAKAETVELTSSNCEWYNYLQYSSHYWQFWGYDDTHAYQFSFYKYGGNMVDGQEVPDGTWDVSALDGKYITYADELAESGVAKPNFVSGSLKITTDPYGAYGEFEGVAEDGNTYIIHITGGKLFTDFWIIGDFESGGWSKDKAKYIGADKEYLRVVEPGKGDFKLFTYNDLWFCGNRLDTANSSDCVIADSDPENPITIGVSEKSYARIKVSQTGWISVQVAPYYQMFFELSEGKWVAGDYSNETEAYSFTAKWAGKDTIYVNKTQTEEGATEILPYMITYMSKAPNEENWNYAKAPAVGTQCTYEYNMNDSIMYVRYESDPYNFPDVDWIDVVAGQGWWQLKGYNADSTIFINLSPSSTDHVDGTYTTDEMYYAKLMVKDEMAEGGFVEILFTEGTIVVTSDDFRVHADVNAKDQDGKVYVCNVNSLKKYQDHWIMGDFEPNLWSKDKATLMRDNKILRALEPGSYDFKVLTKSRELVLGGTRLDVANSSACATGDDDPDQPINITVDKKVFVTISASIDSWVTVVESPYAPYYIKHSWGSGADADWAWKSLHYNNAEEAYAITQRWGGIGCNIHATATEEGAQWFSADSIKFYGVDEESGYLKQLETAPEVGTICDFVYNDKANTLTVTVNAEGEITPDDPEPEEGFENTEVSEKVVKVLEGGHVIIIRNGVHYDIIGARL